MLEAIEQYLVNQGLVNQDSIFIGSWPDAPDNATCLYETTGWAPTLTFDNTNVEYPGLQIICRGTSYQETRQRINDIYKKLHGNTAVFLNIIAQQSPVSLGTDNKKRCEFSVNFKIIKNM